MNTPVVKVNGEETEDYEIINGTFEYDQINLTYSTTNATLIVYNTTAGSNTIEIGFEGARFGRARYRCVDEEISSTDAMFILQFVVGYRNYLEAYDYADVHNPERGEITSTDAMYILQSIVGTRDEFYNIVIYEAG